MEICSTCTHHPHPSACQGREADLGCSKKFHKSIFLKTLLTAFNISNKHFCSFRKVVLRVFFFCLGININCLSSAHGVGILCQQICQTQSSSEPLFLAACFTVPCPPGGPLSPLHPHVLSAAGCSACFICQHSPSPSIYIFWKSAETGNFPSCSFTCFNLKAFRMSLL